MRSSSLQQVEVLLFPKVHVFQVTLMVVRLVEEMKKTQGYHNLKIFNRKKEHILLVPINLSTGVWVRIQMMMIPKIRITCLDDENDWLSIVDRDSSSDEEDNDDGNDDPKVFWENEK